MAKQQVQIAKNFAFNDLTNCYSVQKTLKFSLIPQGKTLEHIHNKEFLKRDKERFENAQKVKEFVDEVHREFITNALEHTNVAGWEELEKVLEGKGSKKDKKAELRKAISKQFERFDKEWFEIFKSKKTGFITKGKQSKLCEWMLKKGYTQDDINVVKRFNGFGGYFNTYITNRANMYLEGGQATSVFTRAVDDNFRLFLKNQDVLIQAKKEGVHLSSLEGFEDSLVKSQYYNKWLSPNGISDYNNRIGQLNAQLNEAKTKGNLEHKIKLYRLKKQILCEGESSFPPIEKIQNDGELAHALNIIKTIWFIGLDKKGTDSELTNSIVAKAEDAVAKMVNEAETIKITRKNLSQFSQFICGEWDALENVIRNSLTGKKKRDWENWEKPSDTKKQKQERKMATPLKSCVDLYNAVSDEKINIEQIANKYKEKINNIKNLESSMDSLIKSNWNSKEKKLIADENAIECIVTWCDGLKKYDGLKKFEREMKVFENEDDEFAVGSFYDDVNEMFNAMSVFDKNYNKVRNYLTQKPYSTEKLLMKFDKGTLLNGWDIGNELDKYLTSILRKNNKYYLAVLDRNNKPKVDLNNLTKNDSSEFYEKLVYKQISSPVKDIPKKFFSKERNSSVPQEIKTIKDNESYKKDDSDRSKYLKYLIEQIEQFEKWKNYFEFNCKKPEDYDSMDEFYNYITQQGYHMSYIKIPVEEINSLVNEGKLYLFQIYNKDYSPNSTGSKNLHTLFWEYLFSDSNRQRAYPVKLNGGASLYYRKKSIKPKGHKTGEILVNKTYEDDDGAWKAIPDDIYVKATEIAKNGSSLEQVKSELSKLDRGIKFNIKECKHEIVKDKRYTKDHFQFHVPITLNRCPEHDKDSAKYINQHVLEIVKNNKDITFLGIDRGERHLLYLTLIDKQGNILMQKSMNLVPTKVADNKVVNIDYHSKLDNKQKSRDKSRKSWRQIENIKDLKQGYLSQVVHEIAKIVVEHNAVIVMENLNSGFKRGRQKFEKQVYQRFEKQLIDKLSYLSFKPGTGIAANDVCGIANGLQLCPKFGSFKDLKDQHGIIFYVRPWNTSHIDPTTGFMNLFRFPKSNTGKQWKEFFGNFNAISYDKNEECFRFDFKYSKFDGFISVKDYQDEWSAYTHGQRLFNEKNEVGKYVTKPIDVTKEIETLFRNKVIGFKDKQNLKDDIFKLDAKDIRDLGRLFKRVCNLRNSETNSDVDYILSPVKNSKGEFFDSRNAKKNQPENADANGAYHIALKGLQASEKVTTEKSGKFKVQMLKNIEWNEWIQKFHAKKC